jgi:SAM-dependent methyltransferase
MNPVKRLFRYLYRPQVHLNFNNPIYYYLHNRGHFLNTVTGILPFYFKKHFMDLIVMERIVEVPFAHQNLKLPQGSRVLEIGCVDSKVSIELSSLGYKVSAYDLRDYDFTHPNLNFTKGDFLKNTIPEGYFDGALAISVIEHCGLDIYGGIKEEGLDILIVKEICRVLKKGGRFIITVPFGLKGKGAFYRVYDSSTLAALLDGFNIIDEQYFKTAGRKYWIGEKKENLSGIPSRHYTEAVACIVCEKPR